MLSHAEPLEATEYRAQATLQLCCLATPGPVFTMTLGRPVSQPPSQPPLTGASHAIYALPAYHHGRPPDNHGAVRRHFLLLPLPLPLPLHHPTPARTHIDASTTHARQHTSAACGLTVCQSTVQLIKQPTYVHLKQSTQATLGQEFHCELPATPRETEHGATQIPPAGLVLPQQRPAELHAPH